jgi:AraC-like DNA-binding protein
MSVDALYPGPDEHRQIVAVEPLFYSRGLSVARWTCRIRETGGRGMLEHGRHVMKFVHTGAFRARLADGPVMMDATRTLLAAPHEPFEVTKQFGPAVSGSAISISDAVMAAKMPHWNGSTRLLRVEVTPRAVLMQHFILRQIARGTRSEAIEELILALALEAFREPRVVPIVTRRQTIEPRRDIVEMAQALLASNYDRAVRLEDVARAVEISPFHLCRAFKRVTGVHMREYITRLRLRAAVGEVIDPQSSLATIAHEHGFSSHSHFAAAFRKEFQITPSDVRQMATLSASDLRTAFDRFMTNW